MIDITPDNIETEHICCAIGNDAENSLAASKKKDWLRDRFNEGLVFRRLEERGKVFIEYMPIEQAWKPVNGKDFLFINCLWVSGKFKGQGFAGQLLKSCIEDARKSGKKGVAVISSKKTRPFLTDRNFFIAHGFAVSDTAPLFFELLSLSFGDVPSPRFTDAAKSGKTDHAAGLYITYSRQCPFTEKIAALLIKAARDRGFTAESHCFASGAQARASSGPTGTFSIFWNGNFVTHEMMGESKFDAFFRALS